MHLLARTQDWTEAFDGTLILDGATLTGKPIFENSRTPVYSFETGKTQSLRAEMPSASRGERSPNVQRMVACRVKHSMGGPEVQMRVAPAARPTVRWPQWLRHRSI